MPDEPATPDPAERPEPQSGTAGDEHREQSQLESGEAGGADERPLPVLAEVHPIEPARPVPLPVAVAAATGGFLLGVATFVLVRVLRRPGTARRVSGGRLGKRGKRIEVAASRSFLVDVHLLKDR